MREKVANEIALRQATIEELKDIKLQIENSIDEEVKFNVVTRHLVGYDIGIYRRKAKLDVSSYTMKLILDEIIKKERERIDKLIDIEIERRLKKEGK